MKTQLSIIIKAMLCAIMLAVTIPVFAYSQGIEVPAPTKVSYAHSWSYAGWHWRHRHWHPGWRHVHWRHPHWRHWHHHHHRW